MAWVKASYSITKEAMLMHIVKNGLCLVITIAFVAFSMFTSQKAPMSNVQSEYDLEHQYIIGLQEHRERCYEHILFLGTVSDRELTLVKRELETYLDELYLVQQQVKQMGVPDVLFQEIVILDEQFIMNTLQAIDLKDERYLENLAELYSQLEDYHKRLQAEYVSQKD